MVNNHIYPLQIACDKGPAGIKYFEKKEFSLQPFYMPTDKVVVKITGFTILTSPII